MAEEKRLVWDLPLRLFHWLFATSIFASWYTAEVDEMEIHFWLGYFMIGLIVFRLVWGFIGPRHARFSSFLQASARDLAVPEGRDRPRRARSPWATTRSAG